MKLKPFKINISICIINGKHFVTNTCYFRNNINKTKAYKFFIYLYKKSFFYNNGLFKYIL